MIKLVFIPNKFKAIMLTGLIGLLHLTQANANECIKALPDGAIEEGLPKICRSDFSGTKVDYACQDYQAGEQRFRVLYQGGITPKAILKLEQGQQKLVSIPSGYDETACPLPAPAGISAHALHVGTGICLDRSDEVVPCSVYEHAQARQVNSYRYMVFYKTDKLGKQSTFIDHQVANSNNDAMAAELAYQIGVSLLNTECCSDQAAHYLAYAHQLFPHANLYKKAYQLSLISVTDSKLN